MSNQAASDLARLAPTGITVPAAFWSDLESAYDSPRARAYHSIEHAVAVARHYASVARDVGWHRPIETYLAVLFHDAVYVAGAHDNEACSAALARVAIATRLSSSAIDAERVAALIELTACHGSLVAADVDPEAALFLDCDMAILGADPESFAVYSRVVRQEYAHVPEDAYRAGRGLFLSRLLASPAIFLSHYFEERFEQQARTNVARSLAELTE